MTIFPWFDLGQGHTTHRHREEGSKIAQEKPLVISGNDNAFEWSIWDDHFVFSVMHCLAMCVSYCGSGKWLSHIPSPSSGLIKETHMPLCYHFPVRLVFCSLFSQITTRIVKRLCSREPVENAPSFSVPEFPVNSKRADRSCWSLQMQRSNVQRLSNDSTRKR